MKPEDFLYKRLRVNYLVRTCQDGGTEEYEDEITLIIDELCAIHEENGEMVGNFDPDRWERIEDYYFEDSGLGDAVYDCIYKPGIDFQVKVFSVNELDSKGEIIKTYTKEN